MAFYMDSKEKCNVHGDDFKNRLLTIFTIKVGETRSMAFYNGLSKKS
ncbi:hypothetical protein T4B_3884 [Trichinella pseudospiralis]|uniref:PiggyBac transposable element-derived protein domain-containing protein n=2 Tax=Trichinella pseudospiralis TaxID=6337 RepID=A0A0V1G725_TRIPS|nr:hypothetical protein T4A_11142 [Trichinella pseudospiralis]KRY93909.1 hypothetical protein T4B_3884 [Trichinella pseudospiralis]KRZ00999.1 hypothetical protein T4C_1534 [Trichinella pseudospiralis]